jgi:tetratricopeptide (TPR) repeat protein
MVEAGGGDEHYKALFKQMMMAQCESHTAIGESGTRIVKLVTRQQELLLEYRTITQQEESKENQMSCIVNVLDFYKGIDRDELYVKYLKKLCSLHEQCQNWAEAAFTLLQYSDSLEWSERPVKHIWKKHASCRTQRALKEQLCRDAIKNFEKGKMWEKALDICKDLAKQYEEETYDYPKLADLYQKIAGYYRSIMTEVRPDAEYFRVAFWGRGFPAFLQNKIFVYRGKGYEKLPDFQTRILDQFPNAKMMTTLKTPSDEEKELGVQLLQINKVDPVMGVAGTKFQGKPFVQQQIINYYKANEVRRFTYSRPFTRGGVNKENEFANLWIERTVLQTKYTFPGVLQWFVLCQPEELFELCPIDNAIETMQKANEDLRGLIMDHANPPVPPPLNPLTMKLNGTIDAAVNGGTAKYEQAFFTDEYLEDNPEHEEKVRVLKDQIANQIPLLDACIKIHDLKKTDDLQPLHDRLEGMFKTMRTQVEAKYGKRWCDITVRKANTHGGVRKGSMNNTNGGVGDVATMRRGGPQMHSLTAAESKMDLTRASFVSQGSLHDQSASKTERVFSALGISRKRSGAQDLSRTSVGRLVGQISSTAISENGGATGSGGSNGSSNTSSIDLGSGGGGSGGDANWSSPTVVITQTAKSGGGGLMMSSSFHGGSSRPTSGQFLNSSTPLHSRSPSIASNRESIVSVEENTVVAAAPPVPPKSNRGSSDAENTSMSSFDYEEKPTDREEYAATRHIIITARKRAPPPPPPPIQAESDEYAQSPPTPPRKPQFGTPFE